MSTKTTLPTTPKVTTAPGAGSVALNEETGVLDLVTDQLGAHLLTTTITSTIDRSQSSNPHSTRAAATRRAATPDYHRWLDHVASVRGCERPIRLAGHLHTINPATGEILSSRTTETLPDGVIYVPCGDRRATVCPGCAETYRADT
ncbi:MAG: plasmid replication initiator protein RepSA, partial [Actinobacteria bacterium]|nr:plasmid replication initiator protein RepSA [Actinomycetota bacterium]